MPIRRTLVHVPQDRPVAVMLRHAERFAIRTADDGWEARLTEAGHVQARELGAAIAPKDRPVRLWSSPIPRCQQTAARVAEGMRAQGADVTDAEVIRELAGPYLHDANAVMGIALSIGDQAFVRRWFDGGLDHAVLLPARRAAEGQLQVLVDSLRSAERGIDLHVSHDWNILLVREHFVGVRHEDVGMPGFLDGLAVWLDGAEIIVHHAGRSGRHPMPA